MSVIVRPGPDSIGPGGCPTGLVIHIYGVPTGRLILVTESFPGSDAAIEFAAAVDGSRALALSQPGEGFCLVVFDGDSGERFSFGPGFLFCCQFCSAVSYSPPDAVERYCGRCHRFADPDALAQSRGF